MRPRHHLGILVTFLCVFGVDAQQEEVTRSFPSPDARFVLKINEPDGQSMEGKFEVIEKASGKVVGDLGTDYAANTHG